MPPWMAAYELTWTYLQRVPTPHPCPPKPAQTQTPAVAPLQLCSSAALQLSSSAALQLSRAKKNGRRSARSFISAKRDEKPHHTLTRFSGARYSFWPSFTSKA